MKRRRSALPFSRRAWTQAAAVVGLLLIGALALAGPGGLLAWSDEQQQLEARQTELARLTRERDALRNRVELLDQRHVDPDLAGELVRDKLGVAHQDELVMMRH